MALMGPYGSDGDFVFVVLLVGVAFSIVGMALEYFFERGDTD